MQMFQTQLDAQIGRDFSERLMPKRIPSVEGYRLRLHSEAREQGGGDLFDWTKTDDDTYFITIGDVMGKGLQAKFYAYSFLSYVRGTLHTLLQESTSPSTIMGRINDMLLTDDVLEETFASFLLLHWDPKAHTITYANAGHCRPVLTSPDGAEVAEHSDLILGLEPNATFTDATFDLDPGMAVLIYTDGLLEQPVLDGDLLGEPGVVDIAASIRTADEPLEALIDETMARSPHDRFQDDILFFWLQRLENGA